MPPPHARGNLVRKWRRWSELTQSELAETVGVSRQTIANIENGNYSPSVHLALDICRTLDRTVEEIFGTHSTGAADSTGTPGATDTESGKTHGQQHT